MALLNIQYIDFIHWCSNYCVLWRVKCLYLLEVTIYFQNGSMNKVINESERETFNWIFFCCWWWFCLLFLFLILIVCGFWLILATPKMYLEMVPFFFFFYRYYFTHIIKFSIILCSSSLLMAAKSPPISLQKSRASNHVFFWLFSLTKSCR